MTKVIKHFLKRTVVCYTIGCNTWEVCAGKKNNIIFCVLAHSTRDNLISAFNKTGIYPLDRSAISEISVLPAEVFVSEDTQNNITDVLSVPENPDLSRG
jgi:hypothetical protein